MAWRIHDSVRKGEIDNRERGLVRGRLWLDGYAKPIVLHLAGNACPDLAGCLLTFKNTGETVPMPLDARMSPVQDGGIGDLTASRKLRVFDVPFDEVCERMEKKLPVPEHTANGLFLEWFSEADGRVVIESHKYKLAISPAAWTLSAQEEEQRQQDAAAGFSRFLGKLTEVVDAQTHEPPPDKEWDEFDYEKLLRESDARTEKYMELLDKYQDHPDGDRIIAHEMDWEWMEEPADEKEGADQREEIEASETTSPAAGAADKDDGWPDVEEFERIAAEEENSPPPDPATEGVDWIRVGDAIKHPLSHLAFEGAMRLWHLCDELKLTESNEYDLCQLIGEYQTTGAKLAGALDGLRYGRGHAEGPFVVACLKRALHHLHAALAALEKVAPRKVLPPAAIRSTRAELFGIREETLRLMGQFRSR